MDEESVVVNGIQLPPLEFRDGSARLVSSLYYLVHGVPMSAQIRADIVLYLSNNRLVRLPVNRSLVNIVEPLKQDPVLR